MTTHRLLAALSGTTGAGAFAGALWGALLPPGGAASAWQSAALGAVLGGAAGVLGAPMGAWLLARFGAAARAWVDPHGRAVAVTAFSAPLVLAGTWLVAMLALPPALERIQVSQVAAFVALVVVLTSALGLVVAAALLGRAWSRRVARRTGLRGAVLHPLLAGVAVTVALCWLFEHVYDLVLGPSGAISPWGAMEIAAEAVDLVGVLIVLSIPLLAPLATAAALRARALCLLPLALGAGLVVALSSARETAHSAWFPGPRRVVLRALQRPFDRDGDGFAPRFGGGDCDDRDPRVNPDAEEVPGNGRDDDCAGGDLARAYVEAIERPDPMNDEVRAAMEAVVPRDLNVILLTIDALRADLHYAGNPRNVSPNLDRLAARSVVFTRAYATATATLHSISALLTGRYSQELIRSRGTRPRFDPSNVFVVERMRAAGWSSAFVSSDHLFDPEQGLSQGFGWILDDAVPARAWTGNVVDDRVADRMARLIAEPPLETNKHFLWAHFYDPHEGYVPHPEFGDFGPAPTGSYWQEVAWTDRQIGRVLDAIDALPEARRRSTLLIVTSDHGEALGEHGAHSHGTALWEVQMRVPLMVLVPGVSPRRVDTPRSLIDVVPTVLDLLRLPHPAPAAPDALSGRSLVPDLLGFHPPPRPIYAQLPADGWTGVEIGALIDGRWKIIRRGPSDDSLYDLVADPDEAHDLAATRGAELTRMRGLLSAFRVGLRRPRREPAPR